MTKMIERNTTIPHSKTETFSTAADNQTAVDVYVFQGERQMARDNKMIGNFRLSDIPPAPRGMPQVEVTFDIDANGILSVKAKDKATGKEQRITIEASSGLSESEIEQMVNEAKSHEAEDAVRRELIEARNQLDSRIYEVEKTLGEHGDKLPANEKTDLEAELAKAREAKDKDELDVVKAALESLTQASHKLAQVMYESQGDPAGGAPGADAGGAAGGGDDDVIDADADVEFCSRRYRNRRIWRDDFSIDRPVDNDGIVIGRFGLGHHDAFEAGFDLVKIEGVVSGCCEIVGEGVCLRVKIKSFGALIVRQSI